MGRSKIVSMLPYCIKIKNVSYNEHNLTSNFFSTKCKDIYKLAINGRHTRDIERGLKVSCIERKVNIVDRGLKERRSYKSI